MAAQLRREREREAEMRSKEREEREYAGQQRIMDEIKAMNAAQAQRTEQALQMAMKPVPGVIIPKRTPTVLELMRGDSTTTGIFQKVFLSSINPGEDGFCATLTIEVREGDTIDGAKITKINEDMVEFEKGGKKWTQRLNEPPGPQWQ